MKRGSEFDSAQPDWTRGRAQAFAEAEALARRQTGMQRRVSLGRDASSIAPAQRGEGE